MLEAVLWGARHHRPHCSTLDPRRCPARSRRGRPTAVRLAPSHALTEDERQAVLKTTPRQARGPLYSPIQSALRAVAGVWREGILNPPQVLHGDNGSPLKGATVQALLGRLGIAASFSRLGASDDNARSLSRAQSQGGYPARAP